MRRRSFIRSISTATVGGMAVRGFGDPLLGPLLDRSAEDRVLVIVQLYGGNDGLNTVIPLDQYSDLSTARSNILIPEGQVLPLQGTNGATGLHPVMDGMRALWDDGKLSIVQGVGYPDPDLSHFRSTDIWETGANSDQLLDSGWTGRFLHQQFPNYPLGFPNDTMPDPLAIRIGAPVTIGLQHMGGAMGASIYNTQDGLDLSGNLFSDTVTADCKGDLLDFARQVQRQADLYGDVIEAAALPSCNLSTLYPTGSQPGAELAQALKIVAQLICGGLRTRIYWVSMDGFDTHAQQVVAGSPSTGTHAELLQGLSDSIRAFQDDLQLLGISDRVLGLTFSEFGRRIKSNASIGTDHGTAAPLFLFGDHVLPGMQGDNPEIPENATFASNLSMQFDFRRVYASVLRDWFCLEQTVVDDILLAGYDPLPVIDPAACLGTGLRDLERSAGRSMLEIFPNPFDDITQARFDCSGQRVRIHILDAAGHLVLKVLDQVLAPGTHTVTCDLSGHAPGMYFCQIRMDEHQQMKSMMKLR